MSKNVYLPPTRISPEMRDQLRLWADRKTTSVSQLVREGILLLMEKLQKTY